MEKVFNGVTIEYRLPSFIEGLGLQGRLGFGTKYLMEADSRGESAYYLMLEKLVKETEKFIIKIDGAKDFESLLETKEGKRNVLIIANEILESISEVDEEKKD